MRICSALRATRIPGSGWLPRYAGMRCLSFDDYRRRVKALNLLFGGSQPARSRLEHPRGRASTPGGSPPPRGGAGTPSPPSKRQPATGRTLKSEKNGGGTGML